MARTALRSGAEAHLRFGCGFIYVGSENHAFQLRGQEYQALLRRVDDLEFSPAHFADSNVGGMYFHLRDEIQFSTEHLDQTHMAGSLIHELVHWLQDSARLKARRWEWEATAYLGQALWYAATTAVNPRLLGNTPHEVLAGFERDRPDGFLGRAASILRATGASAGTPLLRREQIEPMRSLIRNAEAYRHNWNDMATGNGV